MSDDWIEQLTRDYQDVIVGGLYEGVYALGEESLDRVMRCQAEACFREFVKLYDLSESLDLDSFLSRMKTGGPSPIDIRRDGDTILWEERHGGRCMCPLVRREVVPLHTGLCRCAVHWLRMLIERHARRPAEVELLQSVAAGGDNCVFRISLASE